MRAIVASLLYKKKTERAHYTPEEVKRSSSTRSRDGSRRSSPPTDFSSERLRVASHATRGADGDRARVRIDAPPTPLSARSFGDAFHRARGVGRPSRRRRGGSRRSLRRASTPRSRASPPVSNFPEEIRGPRDGDDEAREAGVRGELTRGACGGETAKVRVWTSRAIHVTVGPRASVLEDVPDEVEGGEGHGGEREDRGSASLPTGASSGAGFPVDHLGDVGEDGEGDGEGYGVGELLGGFRGGDAHETREQQGPTSGTHEGGNAERDGEDGGPNLGGGAGNGGSGGNADEGPALLRLQPSGDAILHVSGVAQKGVPKGAHPVPVGPPRSARDAVGAAPRGGNQGQRPRGGRLGDRRTRERLLLDRRVTRSAREGLKRGWEFRPGAMPAQRVARGRRIRGPRSISSKVADLLLPETPAGRGCF